jgi:hypothetical protein
MAKFMGVVSERQTDSPLKHPQNYGPARDMGRVMREYCFYFLDQQSKIQSLKITYCLDDVSALEFAQELRASADIEVWHGTRLVTRLNAPGGNA